MVYQDVQWLDVSMDDIYAVNLIKIKIYGTKVPWLFVWTYPWRIRTFWGITSWVKILRSYDSTEQYHHVSNSPLQCTPFLPIYLTGFHKFWPHSHGQVFSLSPSTFWLIQLDWNTWLFMTKKLLSPSLPLSILIFLRRMNKLYFLIATFLFYFVSI